MTAPAARGATAAPTAQAAALPNEALTRATPARRAPATAAPTAGASAQAAAAKPRAKAAAFAGSTGLIARLVDGEDLTECDMVGAVEALMGGEVPSAQAASFLTALRMKGETVEEIVGAARVMREHASTIPGMGAGALMDTCGTGGDVAHTFNISTTAAFVLAGAGVRVAKHGNRAVSSSCGSADVLEALGVRLDVSVETVGRCVADVGIGFLFAPALHTAMRHVAPVRRELGIRTIFNLLGPLTNPAGADRQVVGVYRADVAPLLAAALGRLGSVRAMVVHGSDGLDEITITGPTQVAEWYDGRVRDYEIRPDQVGMDIASIESIRGGDAAQNAGILCSVLSGEPGPRRDVVLLNAGAALLVAGVVDDLAAGVAAAAESVDSGRALAKLDSLVRVTTQAVAATATVGAAR